MKIPLESEQDFPKFLKRVRKEANVLLEQLSEGLMSASQLARIEKGQRPVCKDLRDRLSGRLGTASDLYENLLDIEDYKAWEQQRDILCAIEQKDFSAAQKLIEAYERQQLISYEYKIKQQFCLVMKAEILKQQSAGRQDIGDCYEKAVKLTVPNIDNMCIEKSLLSIQEINMVLEYEFYHEGDEFTNKCTALMTFVENAMYDELSKVKVYPKIVYYYLQRLMAQQKDHTPEKLTKSLEICNKAIEMLRNTGRAYFLLELLEEKAKLLEILGRDMQEHQECIELINLLKKLYEKYEVSAYMQDCSYLYRKRWVFYIGDVLRIRRKMYGLTQGELCKGICAVKTLRRMEKMQANMQHGVLGVLLRGLGLSKEYQRARLVTSDREVLELREELLTYRNNRDFAKCRELLNQMREKVSLEIPENRQYVMELEASLDWREGKITKEEFAAREEEALRCTLNTEELLHINEVYLTEMEMLCIRKKIQALEGSDKKEYIDFMLHFFERCEKTGTLSDYISMYEFVMISIVSELGNIGQYQTAIELDKKVLKESLTCRRVWVIGNILYDILWNEQKLKESIGQPINKEKMTEELKHCILLSHFCRQTYNEKFYDDKLHQV